LTRLYEAAHKAKLAYDERRQRHVHEQMQEIVRVISALFLRMQANEVYDRIVEGADSQPLSWRALCNGTALDPQTKFSQGQRQDFALAIFLARARGLRGSFFMDEPLAHLDDLNRVALLDVFRAISLESDSGLSFVLTTASRPIARHFLEKFSRLTHGHSGEQKPALNVIELEGNPRVGIRKLAYSS
jgi:exonuclease SbcC